MLILPYEFRQFGVRWADGCCVLIVGFLGQRLASSLIRLTISELTRIIGMDIIANRVARPNIMSINKREITI